VALIAAGSAIISSIIGTVLGSYLQRGEAEHEISFSRLHDRRATVVENLYKRAVAVKRAFPIFIKPGDKDRLNEKLGVLIEAQSDLTQYYEEHRIWLDDESRKRLDTFSNELMDLALDVGNLTLSGELEEYADVDDLRERSKADPEYGAAFVEKFGAAIEERKRIIDALNTLIDGLDAEFRRLLRGQG